MPLLPLVTHNCPEAILAYKGNIPISVARFIAEARWIAELLPPGKHVLNLCSDPYSFCVAFSACIISGRISLLPSTYTPEVVRHMLDIAPDVFCIRTHSSDTVQLPTFLYPAEIPALFTPLTIPQIDSEQVVVQIFTSGSTGLPLPHPKRWGSLVRNVRAETERLGITAAYALLGTVPPQHMYGLESTVLMPFQCGAALYANRPLYPADICAAIENLPRPRLLVTTPYHLRTLLADQPQLPELDLILSATAPLAIELAKKAEAGFAAPLLEIYGCTETGQLASRRTVASPEWQTFTNVHLSHHGQDTWAEGGHIETPTRLNDIIEIVDDGPESTNFRLQGRDTDLINIAGKRTSLAYLNHHLNAIPGVQDGLFVLPEEDQYPNIGVVRLVALVIAPNMDRSTLLAALRERIDPIFLPRPLVFVDSIPRNATGKIPNSYIQNLLTTLRTQITPSPVTLSIPTDHPAYAGHFPSYKILPGVILLDIALLALTDKITATWTLKSVKFLSPFHPGEIATLHYVAVDHGGFSFTISCGTRRLAQGEISLCN